MDVIFYGVRGSCPCPSPANQGYGGNTACVVLTLGREPPIVLDLGTGLRCFGEIQAPPGLAEVGDSVLELADGCDLLIHDAQFTEEELAEKAHWGHSTIGYAVDVARQAGARRLVLFHHDPGHDDDEIDALLRSARAVTGDGPPVTAACEGMRLRV